MPVRSLVDKIEDAPVRVREDLVARARERVRSGFYDREDVTRALVEALVLDLASS